MVILKQGGTSGQGGGGETRRWARDASLQWHVQWRQSAHWLSALGGHSNDSMGGPSTPSLKIALRMRLRMTDRQADYHRKSRSR